MAKYITTRDIVIPAGSRVGIAADRTTRHVLFSEVMVSMTKDSTAHWTMPLDEAIEQGLIEPAS